MQPFDFIWCRRSESNRHFRKERGILSPLRLPVSPLRHGLRLLIGEVQKVKLKSVDNRQTRMLKGLLKSTKLNGVVAQLGERLNGIQEVRSSILLSSTKKIKDLSNVLRSFFYFRNILLRFHINDVVTDEVKREEWFDKLLPWLTRL